jgi:hypothetical protein
MGKVISSFAALTSGGKVYIKCFPYGGLPLSLA